MPNRYRVYSEIETQRRSLDDPTKMLSAKVNGEVLDEGVVPKDGVVEFDSGDVLVHSVQFWSGKPHAEVALGHVEVGKAGKISVRIADLPTATTVDPGNEKVVVATGGAAGGGGAEG